MFVRHETTITQPGRSDACLRPRAERELCTRANDPSGSIATKIDHSGHFRLSLNSGSTEDIAVGPVRAMCGRLRVGKRNLHVAGLVGAAMCSAFRCGSHDRWP
jgi:hypothetical protein